MTDLSPYPPIDPTTFDLIVIGTGLPESIIAAAASAVGKSVLHLDSNAFYGTHSASLSIAELSSFLQNPHSIPLPPPPNGTETTMINLTTRPLYSDLEISNLAPDLLSEHSRSFHIDVSGPRVLFCADRSIEFILKSGANQYVEFKSVDASFMGDGTGALWSVPDSRAAIFKDKSLGLQEKNQLMRFFKRVQEHLLSSAAEEEQETSSRIADADLESPFVEFLEKMRLPHKIKSIILYAIAMSDYDQGKIEDSKYLLKTRDGIDRLALYHASIGRLQNVPGALIYPIYGQGELPQAFCRRAAVKGSIYVLRMPVISLHLDRDNGCFKGIRLASGQDIFSQKLVLDPALTVPLSSASSLVDHQRVSLEDGSGKVARAICITRRALKPDISNCLVIYPPRSLHSEQTTSIRALQIGQNLAVCPPGMFVLYLSTLCDKGNQWKELLRSAINTLLTIPDPGNPDSSSLVECEKSHNKEVQPTLLWSALYVQELSTVEHDFISSAPMPDGNLSYNNLLDATLKLFQKIYPDEEFFPETVLSDNSEEDGGLGLET
ncbi:rab proteins geranylgeranyltransferase component A [Tripterygium wilfordii]|uniref:Rab escort protein 1 n=1 Tax=Tripterygium wilfordii TaxID=458696 RepID=A0A7J7CVE8_TRIWF|nr:rab escort protein 1-like [Tripterygium wilfordii]KAF5738092.1 rab proteins geranylgeranyltransferase component A [Tripterygium wilfordii]